MHNKPHTEKAKRKMSAAHTGVPLPGKRRPSKIVGNIEHWRCSSCHQFLPREGFYKNKRTILGITSECRKCHVATAIRTRDKGHACDTRREAMRMARRKNPGKYRMREREASRRRGKTEKTVAR